MQWEPFDLYFYMKSTFKRIHAYVSPAFQTPWQMSTHLGAFRSPVWTLKTQGRLETVGGSLLKTSQGGINNVPARQGWAFGSCQEDRVWQGVLVLGSSWKRKFKQCGFCMRSVTSIRVREPTAHTQCHTLPGSPLHVGPALEPELSLIWQKWYHSSFMTKPKQSVAASASRLRNIRTLTSLFRLAIGNPEKRHQETTWRKT